MSTPRFRIDSGFTLVELLVATSVTISIVVLVMQCFFMMESSWRRSEQRTDTFRSARAALDVMGRDLRAVALPAAPPSQPSAVSLSGTSATSYPVLVLDYADDTLPEDRFNDQIHALVFSQNVGRSSLCAVSYHCVWDDTTKTYSLRRFFKNSDSTFAVFKSAGLAGLSFPSVGDLYFKRQTADDELAACVWNLEFRPSDGGTVANAYPQRAYGETLPAWIEIRFKAAAPSAMKRLSGANGDRTLWEQPDSARYKRDVLPHAQQFSLRVKLEMGSQ